MPLNQADREEIQAMIDQGTRALVLTSPSTTKCRAEYPHEGKLRYSRGNPPIYICECGARYMKDGKGGLRDA